MASRRSRPRRFLLPLVLAATLVAEITGLAIAGSIRPSAAPATASAASSTSAPAAPFATNQGSDAVRELVGPVSHTPPSFVSGPRVSPASPVRSTRVKTSGAAARTATARSSSPAAYRGRYHVWIPSLGINRSVTAFPCARTRPPDNHVYRWGCAGRNNVYLLGHAYSVFKPLHDAYTGGRLRKGMKVVYADGAGRVHTYSVIWWRVVAPTTAASWAWAAQSRPSMTLQTCVGSRSQYRLMVRLVRVG
jgi:hypothetical protein